MKSMATSGYTITTSITNTSKTKEKEQHVNIEVEQNDSFQRSNVGRGGQPDSNTRTHPDVNHEYTKDKWPQEVLFLGFDLSSHSSTLQFCILSGGIFFFYLLYGISLEQIFRLPGK